MGSPRRSERDPIGDVVDRCRRRPFGDRFPRSASDRPLYGRKRAVDRYGTSAGPTSSSSGRGTRTATRTEPFGNDELCTSEKPAKEARVSPCPRIAIAGAYFPVAIDLSDRLGGFREHRAGSNSGTGDVLRSLSSRRSAPSGEFRSAVPGVSFRNSERATSVPATPEDPWSFGTGPKSGTDGSAAERGGTNCRRRQRSAGLRRW